MIILWQLSPPVGFGNVANGCHSTRGEDDMAMPAIGGYRVWKSRRSAWLDRTVAVKFNLRRRNHGKTIWKVITISIQNDGVRIISAANDSCFALAVSSMKRTTSTQNNATASQPPNRWVRSKRL